MKNYNKLYDKEAIINLNKKDADALLSYFKKKKGWVYIASTEDNTYLKIGRTAKSPLNRAKSLSSTGVLNDYKIIFAVECLNSYWLESEVHKKLHRNRIKKEFFSVRKEIAMSIIEEKLKLEKELLEQYLNYELIKEDISVISFAIK